MSPNFQLSKWEHIWNKIHNFIVLRFLHKSFGEKCHSNVAITGSYKIY
jgi:hypothetical protein